MINITGIGTLNELQVARPTKAARNLPAADNTSTEKDGVAFSSESKQAAEVAGFLRESAKVDEIRQKQVTAAKENVEQGRHRVEDVVHAVAAAIIGQL
mgnify:CR=1 FL=1